MAKKPKGLRRSSKIGPAYPKEAALTMKAHSGKIDGRYYGFVVEKLGKYHYVIFRSKFAARKYLDLLIGEDEVIWTQDNVFYTDPTDLRISGENIKMLMDYRYKSSSVKIWELSNKYKEYASYLKNEREYVAPLQESRRTGVSRKGMILIGDIAKELDISPKEARGVLRDLDYEKPAHGWAWKTRAEADEIKQTLQQSLS